MRHRKATFKIGRTASHRRCLIANMLKSLIVHGEIKTGLTKAKELRRHADRMITIAKTGSLAARRRAVAKMMVRNNKLTPKEARAAKAGNTDAYNDDRKVLDILFNDLAKRFADRNGGYTRIVRTGRRVGDNSETCVISFMPAEVEA